MPRIRTITAAGVLAGATVLGGAGLAGATDSSTEVQDPAMEELRTQVLGSDTGDDLTTGEAEGPASVELPDQAAERADEALAAAAAAGDQSTEAGDDTSDDPAMIEEDEDAEHDNHGEHVSEVARADDARPGHGDTVSATARQHGDAQRAAGDAGATESDDDAEEAEVEKSEEAEEPEVEQAEDTES